MKKLAALIAVSLMISGCAPIISAIKARPVAAHKARETRMWTSTGERRFSVFYVIGDKKSLLCPEAVPFTAQAIASTGKPNLAPSGIGTFSDDESFTTTLTSIGSLTENLSALDRNFSNSCNAFIAGVLLPDQFRSQIEADNAVRRAYVLAAASKKTEDKDLKAMIDAAVKDAVDKVKKDWVTTVSISPSVPASVNPSAK